MLDCEHQIQKTAGRSRKIGFGEMGKRFHFIVYISVILCGTTVAQVSNNIAMLSVEEPANAESETPKVTSVYGISADDYLPSVETLRKQVRPNVRAPASRPTFDLPDAFYFIGGPIFVLLFLRVLVIFLNGFEEKRREEQRKAELQIPETD